MDLGREVPGASATENQDPALFKVSGLILLREGFSTDSPRVRAEKDNSERNPVLDFEAGLPE